MFTLDHPAAHVRRTTTQRLGGAMSVVVPTIIVAAALLAADLYASKGAYALASMAALGRVVRYTFL
jgi:hypothetical protein